MSDQILEGVVLSGPPPASALRIEAIFDVNGGALVEATGPSGEPLFAFDPACSRIAT